MSLEQRSLRTFTRLDDERDGSLHWPGVLEVAKQKYLSADAVQLLKDRLKSEATHIVLNTLTVSTRAARPVSHRKSSLASCS